MLRRYALSNAPAGEPGICQHRRMPRRNRVDPWGDLHAVDARGMFTGNRGCLLDDAGKLARHHNGNLWISCLTEFRGWQHPLDQPRTWTPLFFLDEAVALAAGHRPCGLCRRSDYQAYRDAVTTAVASPSPLKAGELNRRLAQERHRRGRGLDRAVDKILWSTELRTLPPGTVIWGKPTADSPTKAPLLIGADSLQPFDFAGWGEPLERPDEATVEVMTPVTSVAALSFGYAPRLHPSAR